ncbi:MAG: hypothetical protein WCK05_13770 [Planctomycetota bacterium]
MWIRRIVAMAFLASATGGCFNINVPQIPDVNIGNNSSANVGAYGPPPGPVVEGPAAPMPGAVAVPVRLYAPDMLAYPGTEVAMTAVVVAPGDVRWTQGATVTFFHGDRALASAPVNEDGLAAAGWRTPGPGDYHLSARVTAARPGQDPLLRAAHVSMLACVRPREAHLVVVDLDSLTPQAPAIVARLAKQFTIVYAGTRSALGEGAAKDWLRAQGYPHGPLLAAGLKEFAAGAGVFKTARVKDLTKTYPNIRAGVTDKISDAEEYAERGSNAILFPRYKADAKGMRKAAKELEKLKARNRVQVVTSWPQVEQVLAGGASYPAEAFAAWLRQEAFGMDGKRD